MPPPILPTARAAPHAEAESEPVKKPDGLAQSAGTNFRELVAKKARCWQFRNMAIASPLKRRNAGTVDRPSVALLLLLVLLFSLAASAGESISELRKRADAAHGGACAKACLAAAHALVQEASSRFKQGDTGDALAALKDGMDYAQRGAHESMASKKHRKEAEISLRELARRLTDLMRLLEVDQRPPLEADIAELEKLRSQLLSSIFNLKAASE